MSILLDRREKHLRPVYFRLSFRDVIFDEDTKQYLPGNVYSDEDLKDERFEVKISFFEINEEYPTGHFEPFLSISSNEIIGEVVLNSREVRGVKIVVSGEWKKPGDKFLSVWSTSKVIDLLSNNAMPVDDTLDPSMQKTDIQLHFVLDQVSIGREPLMAFARFSPVVERDLEIPANASLELELRRVDIGAVKLPGSVSITQRIILNEDLLLEIPRGQWQYYIRVSEL